jgi:hypothetical protein
MRHEHQLVQVFDGVIFLARSWEEEDGINRYHLPQPEGSRQCVRPIVRGPAAY